MTTRLPTGRFVDLPGRGTTFVREAGAGKEGPALVLLHGWTATSGLNWIHCFEPLGSSFHVVAMDHRGHGRGMAVRSHFRLEDCADDVAALASVLGLSAIVPVGYSMGGPIAQLVWQRHRSLVAGLVLCATSRNFRGSRRPLPARAAIDGGIGSTARALRALPAPLLSATRAGVLWRRRMLGLPSWGLEEVSRNDPAALLEAARCLGRFNSADWIGEVDVPTAVVVTERDRLVPPSRQQRLAAAIPGASVWPVDGDHDVCVAQPWAFAPVLLDACRWVEARVGR